MDDRRSAESRATYPKAKYYKDFKKMLEAEGKNIDACNISTPDNVHAVVTIAAMQLGKHVYTQKPLAHDIYECRCARSSSKSYKVVTQMGNQGGSGDGVRQGHEICNAGMIGDVHTVHAWTNRPVWPQGLLHLPVNFPVPDGVDSDLWLEPSNHDVAYNPAHMPL